MPEAAEELLKGRVQMIKCAECHRCPCPIDGNPANIFWRPLRHQVHNWPIVLGDGRYTSMSDLVAVDQISRRFVGDIYYVTYSPGYKW